MPALLALLGFFVRTGLSFAKWLWGMGKVLLASAAIRAKEWLAFATLRRAAIFALCASLFAAASVAFDAVISRLVDFSASTLLAPLLPTSGPAQFFYYSIWDSGISLCYFVQLSVDSLALWWLTGRVVRVFEWTANLRLRINHVLLSWYHR